MGREYNVQEALKLAIQAEKDSMDFYRKAGEMTKNERAKRVFDLLANEEVGHLKAFFQHFKGGDFGDLQSFMETPPNQENPAYLQLSQSIDEETHEQKALEIALQEEKACIEHYTQLAKDIIDPLVRSIFERVIHETENHYAMIEDEYMHVMTMVHSTDQNIYVRE